MNLKWYNLKDKALETLAQTYPSHGFVIDKQEAKSLFHRVRFVTDSEMKLIEELGNLARHPLHGNPKMEKLETPSTGIRQTEEDDDTENQKQPQWKKY
ncbi:MAG: hypothetical protein L3J67_10560 [Hyphomicrobiaceae bacterium]|nr:hypothetical protein [Hyphomicrobiaceae bacterium]